MSFRMKSKVVIMVKVILDIAPPYLCNFCYTLPSVNLIQLHWLFAVVGLLPQGLCTYLTIPTPTYTPTDIM